MLNLEEVFESFDDDFLKFEKVESKLNPRADLCAFLLLDKLIPGTADMVSGGEHDGIWLDTDCDKLAEIATEADILTLVRCGVRYEDDSLAMFV